MKTATVSELKQELEHCSPARLQQLCLRLVKFKKENKELLTYLLFEAHDTDAFTRQVKQEIDETLAPINTGHVYFAKKTLRKMLRITDKYIRYCGLDTAEAELRMYFCARMKALGLPIKQTPVLLNMYSNQLKKINKVLEPMHEDLQYDYRKELAALGL
jgi:hypothetical protein